MIAGWILAGGHSVKDNEQYCYAPTIIPCMDNIELLKLKVWNKFLTTLSNSATIMSEVTEIKSCFEHLFSLFSFPVLHPPSCKYEAW